MTKDVKTEILAGISTFLTMSYIIFVNPAILSTEGTGMSFSGVMTATILVSFISTLVMGLYAKLPFALAPGMGINAFFTFTIVLGEGVPWPTALGMVFWSGVFFIIISITPLREQIAKAIPQNLRVALACGIGLFLTFIGLKNAMMISADPVTLVKSAGFSLELLFSLIGLFLMIFFLKRKNNAAYLIGIVVVSILALATQKIPLPSKLYSMPDFSSVFFKLDILGALKFSMIPIVIALIMTDMFDSISTFIGVSQSSQMLDENNEPKNMKKALIVDALATFLSSLFGTSAATTYMESSSGVQMGGRTGLTAITTAVCFLPFLFLAPLISVIPGYATAPVLILVGASMFKSVKSINLETYEQSIPAFIVIILIPLSFSITTGIIWGFVAHVMMNILNSKIKEIHPLMWVISIVGIYSLYFT